MSLCSQNEMKESSLYAGFEMGPFCMDDGRIVPQCALIPAQDGRYRLNLTITAEADAEDVLLFTNRRRLIWRGSLHTGETVNVGALCTVHPWLPGDTDKPVKCRGVEAALAAPGIKITDFCAAPADIPAVLLMGDSTVTDQAALSPYAPGATYCGWGQMLPLYLTTNACVGNFAQSGLTVETFRTEGYYDLLKDALRPGDWVLMQFGHNDQKRSHLTASGGYADGLRDYIHEIRALRAKPVVITPLARNSWKNEKQYLDLLEPFAQAAMQVAQETGVPVIDLHGYMKEHILNIGRDAAKALFHVGDYTHTNDFGAYLAAGYVAKELARLGLTETVLCDAWAPHGPYDVPAYDQGDESLPPTGLEALYRAYETNRPDAPLTRQEALELVCRTCGLFAHNAPVKLPADIPLNESHSSDVRCAMQYGIIPEDMLADGKFHRHRTLTSETFMRLLAAAYGMRCSTDNLPDMQGDTITRAQAASICRAAKI